MKKKVVWLIGIAVGMIASAEVVITSPTGLPDESDVALESVVDAVKDLPADTVQVVTDVLAYTGDELRNTAHGIRSAFQGDSTREEIREERLNTAASAWDLSDQILFRSYKVSPVISGAMELKAVPAGAFLDLQEFFSGVDFPKGSSAYLQQEYGQLVVRNTLANIRKIESILDTYTVAEQDYKQVEINAKFIEVSQSTLDQLGFTWRIEDAAGSGLRIADDWQVNDNQDLLSAGIRSAAAVFGGGIPSAGSMVLTKTGWLPLRLTIDAMEQASDSDVLSSPSLTTMDGKKAEIWVGEDRQVPQGFIVGSDNINVHIEHNQWDSQLMGVHFSVTPKIQKNKSIRLDLNPKIIDLIGYDTYQVSPKASMMMVNGSPPSGHLQTGRFPILSVPEEGIGYAWDLMSATLAGVFNDTGNPNDLFSAPLPYQSIALGTSGDPYGPTTAVRDPSHGYFQGRMLAEHSQNGTPLAAVNGSLPYFRVREIKTQVAVADGSTVGLGGLIYDRLETYKDKVPVLGSIPLLGRLFRSEGERSIKRNLMVFVSASQLDDRGQSRSENALGR